MNIWVYCICRNEQLLMPYFIRHYATFAEKLIFYDDRSTDETPQIIKSCPKAELRQWPFDTGLDDEKMRDFENEQWKEARDKADWIAWVDADEFIYHPKLLEVLARYQSEGIELPFLAGYGMVSDFPPRGDGQIYDLIKTGFRSREWDKAELFRPTFEMRWIVGRHSPDVRGRQPKWSTAEEIKLLHYRYLGFDYVALRNMANYRAQPKACREHNYGDNCFPEATKSYSTYWFRDFRNRKFEEVI